jgi:SAM-dependent methyltransferase
VTVLPSFKLSPTSPEATIATYARLASEYDEPAHTTTRALELLSKDAFRRAAPLAHARAAYPVLLELGAGTGALTRAILDSGDWGRLIVTDPAPAMCARLETLVARLARVEAHAYDAAGALNSFGPQADMVLAGLADPFLTPDMLMAARESMAAASLLFVTVPSHNWAAGEREARLRVPTDRTRFRLSDGTHLEAASWSYDEPELAGLVLDAGFRVIDTGTCIAERPVHGALPEVAWALASPA